MSDSEDDTQISVKMPQDPQIGEEKPVKKPRKKMEVSDRRRAASSANLAKAREARLKKKQEKLAAESETQAILNELVAEKKRAKVARPDNVGEQATAQQNASILPPVFGKPEKPAKKQYVELTESEASEESEEEEEESEESEESSSEDSDVEFVLKPAKKKAARNEHARSQKATTKVTKEKAPKRSVIMEQMAAMQAKLDAMEKKEKKSKAAPVNVYFNQKGSGVEKKSALDAKVQWD